MEFATVDQQQTMMREDFDDRRRWSWVKGGTDVLSEKMMKNLQRTCPYFHDDRWNS
jgi:hypothetical protein